MIKAVIVDDIPSAIRELESTGMYAAEEEVTRYGCDDGEHCGEGCECECHLLEISPFDFGQGGPLRSVGVMLGDIIVFEDDMSYGPAILVMESPAFGKRYSEEERREYVARARMSFSDNAEAAYEAGAVANDERVHA